MNFRYSWFEDATAHRTHTTRPASHGRVDGHAEYVRFVSFLNSLVWKYAQGFHEHGHRRPTDSQIKVLLNRLPRQDRPA